MATTILIPTDFCIESLNTLKFALSEQQEPVEVIMLYGQHSGDSITDLLFYSPSKNIRSNIDEHFEKALDIIRNRFGKMILRLEFVPLHAYSKPLLENILDHHRVATIFIPKSYKLRTQGKLFNTAPLLQSTKLPIHEIDWDVQTFSKDDPLQTLFALASGIKHR